MGDPMAHTFDLANDNAPLDGENEVEAGRKQTTCIYLMSSLQRRLEGCRHAALP